MSNKDNGFLTQKQENFTQNLFKGMTQRDAWAAAGYSTRFRVEWIDAHACRLAKNVKVVARLAELRNAVASPLIMSEIARKERLSDVGRANYTAPVRAREIVSAISELNKMEHIYEVGGSNYTDIKVLVIREAERPRELIEGEKGDNPS